MRAAVVGHVEWMEFVPVERVPRAGEIVGAPDSWAQAAGGGAVAAVQLAQLADSVQLFTVLGDDELGRSAKTELDERGIEVHATFVDTPQRKGFTYLDDAGERTITVIGPKLGPRGHDLSLPWHELSSCDAVYFCAGDVDALRNARRARVLVATARELPIAPARSGRARRARRQRQGRRRALPAGRSRPAAAAGGHDVGSARRLGPARRPVHRSRRSRAPTRTRTERATASPPVSHSRSPRVSRGWTRSTSPPAAARVRCPVVGCTRSGSRCRRSSRAARMARRGCVGGEKWSNVGIRGRTIPHESMFYGEYDHTIDDKKRVTLPARFRDELAGGVVLTRGIEKNIDVYPRAGWDANVGRIAELDSLNREARELKRFVFAGATVAELDKQGRVLIPPHLAVHAGIEKDVVLAGVHDRIEIWDTSVWASHLKAIEGSAGDVAERLADKRV